MQTKNLKNCRIITNNKVFVKNKQNISHNDIIWKIIFEDIGH